MLPVLAVGAVLLFLVLHFTGILDDLGVRASGRRTQGWPVPGSRRSPANDEDMNRRLKVFESFIERLSRPDGGEGEASEGHPGGSSPKE